MLNNQILRKNYSSDEIALIAARLEKMGYGDLAAEVAELV
jgi:hypothetical protein